jgi:hypothetical protein
LLFITLSVPAAAERLPTTVLPDHFDLKIVVDLASASFTGDETIRVRVTIEQVESCAALARAQAPKLAAWLERNE